MPPVSSPGSLDSQVPRFTAGDRAARVRFRRAMALMLMTLVLPGSAQLVAGNRKVGRIAMRIWFVLVVATLGVLVVGFFDHELFFWLASDTAALLWLRLVLTAAAIGWAFLCIDAWRIGQPLTLSMGHRRTAVGVNGVLCLTVAGALLFGAHLVGVQRHFILTMFGSGTASSAHDGRYNVLLMGGDSGASRWGLRPDSMTVASIDAETGRTVLISLPRNMQHFPFVKGSVMHQQFPDGFDQDYLNGVNTWALDNTELFPGSKTPGIDATIMAIEGITGLKINYWAMVNLEGFKDLVDAVGGVTLNVRQSIPVGLPTDPFYTHIEPGVQKLDGFDTLWFARARYDSDDYSRMARQKCVMNAMLQQISPQVAVRNFEKIADASSAMISTDIPASEVDRFISLALKARGQKISTLSLVPPMINTADPDIKLIKSKVAQAIDRAEGTADAPGKAKKHANSTVTGGSLGSLSSGYAANESEDLDAAC
ncbi:LCP family protein [Nocardioides mangrovi]|uniref:LCP family protein n=1 Tax=Nocardioides mangrovi TaxID=2874580 RepID=A0ABS7U8P5_9ACTN|nr:LCP family protein [Nocardioides mangrovi]MBZ5737350.1 LCP family protein [Nocardioides mangrovi]